MCNRFCKSCVHGESTMHLDLGGVDDACDDVLSAINFLLILFSLFLV